MKYSFKLYSSYNQICLPVQIPLCSKMKVTKFHLNQFENCNDIYLNINNFGENIYFDGFLNNFKYMLYLPIVSGSNIYSNSNCDNYDIFFDNEIGITYFNIVLISIINNIPQYNPYIVEAHIEIEII